MPTVRKDLSPDILLTELEPVAATCVNRHLAMTREWNPHDCIPWSDGRNFAALGGVDWHEEQSRLSEVARVALITNLLTEDNLPSYHRYIVDNLSTDGAWRAWVGRWTAEEGRHSIAIRDYLVATRSVDPVELENFRRAHMTDGVVAPDGYDGPLVQLVYATLQEVATRISHRQTAVVCHDPVADAILKRISRDENLHAVFYRDVTSAAFDLTPDQTIDAITRVVTKFDMPGRGMPNFRRNAALMAKHGIYDLRRHLDEVLSPTMRAWQVFERDDLTARGEQKREELARYLEQLRIDVQRSEERRARLQERAAARKSVDA